MESKQLEILEKAGEVFMRYGIKATTMDDLGKALGISKKTIYKYFKDKNDLVTQIVQAKTELDKMVCQEAKLSAENAIDEMFRISRFVSELFGNLSPSVFFDLQKYHHRAWGLMEQHKNNYVKAQVIENIERGIKEGYYRSNLKSDIIATVYIASMDAIFDGTSFSSSKSSLSDIFIEIIRFQIRGMANDKGLTYLKKRIKKEADV